MRLNLQTDYALRLLMQLAAHRGGRVTIAETADRFGISKNHLMKVAHALARQGYLETARGRAGGLRLARAPGEIRIGDVVREMEGGLALVECFPGGNGACPIDRSCRLKGALGEALGAFLAVLDRYTLADLVAGNRALEIFVNAEVA